MRRRRKWLGIPLEKRWQRRVFICMLYSLLFSLVPLRFIVGPGPMRPSLFDNPFPLVVLLSMLSLFLWKLRRDMPPQKVLSPFNMLLLGPSRKRPRTLPPGAMDEREQALRDSAHVWAYDVPMRALYPGASYVFCDVRQCFEDGCSHAS